MRLEAKEAESKRVEEMKELEEDNRRKREKVITDKAGIERAQEKLMEAEIVHVHICHISFQKPRLVCFFLFFFLSRTTCVCVKKESRFFIHQSRVKCKAATQANARVCVCENSISDLGWRSVKPPPRSAIRKRWRRR